jgi:UDP-N-acetylglucosamine--N-acetylmuramyl-(pentapeptide) pyrophosphoryl-undecaprenol N-acetylglucosamine transferase
MGLGTSVVRFLATTVCLGLTPNRLPPRAIVTGNPVRPEILKGTRERGLELTHFDGQKPILFVTGGSQGAQAINDAVVTHLPALLKLVDVIHLTGKGKICAEAQPGYWPAETSGGAMGDLYACATLALIRGGAGSISECAATGVPAMIVPIEGLANDHQVHNAERAAAAGGFVLVRQKELPATLVPRIAGLLSNPAQLEAMSESARSLYQPDASARIAAAILAASNA